MTLVHTVKRPLIISVASGNGTDTYVLGDSANGQVGTKIIQVHTTTPGTVAITVKARIKGIVGETPAFAPIQYLSLVAGGAAVAGGTYSGAALGGGAIGDIIMVPASGLDIMLDVVFTDGVHVINVQDVIGASA